MRLRSHTGSGSMARLEAADVLPHGEVVARRPSPVAVETDPHVANRVRVLQRKGRGPVRVAWAQPATLARLGPTTTYRTDLPALDEGERLDYRVELMRSGRTVAAVPNDGTWLSIVGSRAVPDGEDASNAAPATGGGVVRRLPQIGGHDAARWDFNLRFFAALTVDLRAEVLGDTPEGYRINFYVTSGHLTGPHFDAEIKPEGGDWMSIRPDGIGAVNIRITYEVGDGAMVLEQAGGVFDLGPDGFAKVKAGEFTGTPPFYATPKWSTSHPDWQWLNRQQGFGVGRVVLEKLQVQCDIYMPEVLGRLADG